MKRVKSINLGSLLFIIIIFLAALTSNSNIAYASSNIARGTERLPIEQIIEDMFGNKTIKSCKFLYNLDDSADYIYVDFIDYGYAVYNKDTWNFWNIRNKVISLSK